MKLNYFSCATEQEVTRTARNAFLIVDRIQDFKPAEQVAAVGLALSVLINELKLDPRDTMSAIETMYHRSCAEGNQHCKGLKEYVSSELRK